MTSTPERLAAALTEAGAPKQMVQWALEGYYDDYLSPEAMNINILVAHARRAGLDDIAARAIDGEFDGTKEESDAWAASPEGVETLAELLDGVAKGAADAPKKKARHRGRVTDPPT